MNISGTLILVIWLFIPAVVTLLCSFGILPVKVKLKLVLINFVVLYVFIIAGARFQDYRLAMIASSYDLDDSGYFDSSELTPEARVAIKELANDTGRALAPITGFFYSWIYLAIFFGGKKLIKDVIKSKIVNDVE